MKSILEYKGKKESPLGLHLSVFTGNVATTVARLVILCDRALSALSKALSFVALGMMVWLLHTMLTSAVETNIVFLPRLFTLIAIVFLGNMLSKGASTWTNKKIR